MKKPTVDPIQEKESKRTLKIFGNTKLNFFLNILLIFGGVVAGFNMFRIFVSFLVAIPMVVMNSAINVYQVTGSGEMIKIARNFSQSWIYMWAFMFMGLFLILFVKLIKKKINND